MSSLIMAVFVVTLTHLIVGGSAHIYQSFAALAPVSGTVEQ
jgi:hypothetical protein